MPLDQVKRLKQARAIHSDGNRAALPQAGDGCSSYYTAPIKHD